MKDWINMAKALAVLIGLIAAGLLYFAKAADLQTLTQRVDRSEINAEILFQKKLILQYKNECSTAADCGEVEAMEYLEAEHRLEVLREEKKALEGK